MSTGADDVWNRAALERGGPMPLEGDTRLAAMLLAHGLIMNGGGLHALEVLQTNEVAAACRGYRYYRLERVADVLERGASPFDGDADEWEHRLDSEYAALVRSDSVLVERFEQHFRAHPDRYAPMRSRSLP